MLGLGSGSEGRTWEAHLWDLNCRTRRDHGEDHKVGRTRDRTGHTTS